MEAELSLSLQSVVYSLHSATCNLQSPACRGGQSNTGQMYGRVHVACNLTGACGVSLWLWAELWLLRSLLLVDAVQRSESISAPQTVCGSCTARAQTVSRARTLHRAECALQNHGTKLATVQGGRKGAAPKRTISPFGHPAPQLC